MATAIAATGAEAGSEIAPATCDLPVGTRLNINDECVGVVTREKGPMIYIESDVFTGWATKAEILDAIRSAT